MDKFITVKKRLAEESASDLTVRRKPNQRKGSFKIVTMNSNSLANRISNKSDHADMMKFIDAHSPDIIAVQEVRLPAKSFSSNPKKGDESRRDRSRIDDRDTKTATDKRLLQSCEAFKDYVQYFSLSDWRYAGTMLALKKGNDLPIWVAFTFINAENESIKHSSISSSADLATTQVDVGKESTSPTSVEVEIAIIGGPHERPAASDEYESCNDRDGHSADGRFICMGFPSFDLVATYSPNNGSSETSFIRRRLWDKNIKLFFSRAAQRGRPMVWVGDLNVAHTPADVTHPAFFSSQMLQSSTGDSGQAGKQASSYRSLLYD